MKKIPLTQGKFALVDDEDYGFLIQWKWFAEKIGKKIYASKGSWNPKTKSHGKMIRMHRVILRNPIGTIDHIDRDGLNNQKNNLRITTKSQNTINSGIRSTNTSGYKGVHQNKKTKKWVAKIMLNYKNISLGSYINKEDAAIAYNKGAIKYHGKFAQLNII